MVGFMNNNMTTFYLIRHGQKEKIKGDPFLTDLGKEQAEKTGVYLEDKNIKAVYSSNYNRTKETSQIINKFLKVEITFDEKLRERANWGDVENQPFDEFLTEWYEASKNRWLSKHERTTSHLAGENLRNLIISLSKKYNDSDIVIVIHGGVIADFLRNVLSPKFIQNLIKDDPYLLDSYIKECSITKITLNDDKFDLIEFASLKHLL
ncbi:MAG: Phosphoglycerate mutase [Microgenomates group bacterium GW2011_GWD1_33_9]|nr:MAG: Phosphoglycerate mutase [Microgenomates group bacterium GW2011_GWD1_33_9]